MVVSFLCNRKGSWSFFPFRHAGVQDTCLVH